MPPYNPAKRRDLRLWYLRTYRGILPGGQVGLVLCQGRQRRRLGQPDAVPAHRGDDAFFPVPTAWIVKGVEMAEQGSLELLNDPVAGALLDSANPARLAYTWTDGSPRVVPIWFHWTGRQIVLGSPPRAPKLKALAADPRVALTIDDNAWPYKELIVRGRASVEMLDDVSPEYELAATRYFGPEQGPAWISTLRGQPMARIAVTPEWIGILDFETRFPSALTS
jgi:hypothetical protein